MFLLVAVFFTVSGFFHSHIFNDLKNISCHINFVLPLSDRIFTVVPFSSFVT